MKKIAILFLSLLFLLSGCMTVAGDGMTAAAGLSDLVTTVNGETGMDLSGVAVMAEAARDGDTRGVRLYVAAGDVVYAEAVLTADENQAALSLRQSAETPESVYVTSDPDMVQALNEVMDTLIAEPLPDIESMSDEEIEAMMADLQAELNAALEELDPDVPEDLENMSEEDWESQIAEAEERAERMGALVKRCVQPGEPKTIDGVEYETLEIFISNDDLIELLDVRAGDENYGQALKNSGCEVSICGVVYTGDEPGGLDLEVDMTTPEGRTVSLAAGLDRTGDPNTANLTMVACLDGEEAFSASADILSGGGKTADWLDMDLSSAVDLTDMDGDAASELVTNDLTGFLNAAMSSIAGRAAGSKIISALPW